MEAAYSLRERGLEVTVIAPSQEPFETTLGAEVGALFRRVHESHGVRFKLGTIVYRLRGQSQRRSSRARQWRASSRRTWSLLEWECDRSRSFSKELNWTRRAALLLIRGCVPLTDFTLRVTSPAFPIRARGSMCGSSTGAPRSSKDGRRHVICWDATHVRCGSVSSGRDSSTLDCSTSDTRPVWDEIIYRGDVAAQDFLAFFVKEQPCARCRRHESRSRDGGSRGVAASRSHAHARATAAERK